MGWCGNLSGRGVAFFGKMLRRTSAPRAPSPMFFLAVFRLGRFPWRIPRLRFHPRVFRRGPEHGLGWEFAGAGGGAFRQSAAPDVRAARPGPSIFFELCFDWGGLRGGSPVSGSTHACPGGGPNVGILEIPGIRFEIFEWIRACLGLV